MLAARPTVLIAELTYRCPLRCAYCSNPVPVPRQDELSTEDWCNVLRQARELGVRQVHFTGGEPLLRSDLREVIEHARRAGLYPTMVTSAVQSAKAPPLSERLEEMACAGLRAVQVSFQDVEPRAAAAVAGFDAFEQKVEAARHVRKVGLSLTVNVVLHAKNLSRLQAFIDLALDLGADRLELANVQYQGWAAENREALSPSTEQLRAARTIVAAAKLRHAAKLEILHVLADLHADRVKSCMGGLGTAALVVQPSGTVLPCHGASDWPMRLDSVRQRPLQEIWLQSESFTTFRRLDWMAAPCASCPERFRDRGGCRCQALTWTGNLYATDPACPRSPHHVAVQRLRRGGMSTVPLRLRRFEG